MNVRIQKSPIHGRGVFANEPIGKDQWQYIYGETRVILPGDPLMHYGIEWDDELTFMAYAPFCCCNHSSDPNCEISEDPDEHVIMVITALRDIKPDEELTLDYGYCPSED